MSRTSSVTGSEAKQKAITANTFSARLSLRDFVGVSDIESLEPYVKTRWEDYEDRLLGED